MSNKPEPFDEMDAAQQRSPESTPPAAEVQGQVTEPVSTGDSSEASPFAPDVWKEKAQEYLLGWKRAQADYQNMRKSVEQERINMTKYANEALLQDLLPLMDHFNLAFKSIPEEEKKSNWLKGVEHIKTNLQQILQEYGVTLIPTVGEKFDPTRHEAVAEVPSELSEGLVVEELNAGFMLHGKVIQPAKVKVSTGKSK